MYDENKISAEGDKVIAVDELSQTKELLFNYKKHESLNFDIKMPGDVIKNIFSLKKNSLIIRKFASIYIDFDANVVVILDGILAENHRKIAKKKQFRIVDYTKEMKTKDHDGKKKVNKKFEKFIKNLRGFLKEKQCVLPNETIYNLAKYLDSRRIISYCDAFWSYAGLAGSYTVICICATVGFYGFGVVLRFDKNYGRNELASVPGILAITSLVLNPVSYMMKAPGAEIANLRGAIERAKKENSSIEKLKEDQALLFQQGLIISELLSVPAIAIVLFTKPFLKLLQQPEITAEYGQQYYRALAGGIPFFFSIKIMTELLATYDKKIPIILVSASQVTLSTLLAFPFALGLGQCPRLGVYAFGAANAVVASVRSIGLVIYILSNKELRSLGLFKPYCSLEALKKRILFSSKILWDGGFIAVQYILEDIGTVVATFLSGFLGKDELVAVQTTVQYVLPLIALLNSLAQVNAINVGKERGRYNFVNAGRHAIVGFAVTTISMLLLNGLFWGMPKVISEPFINTNAPENISILPIIRNLFRIQGTSLIIRAGKDMFMGALRGYDYNKWPMLFSIIGSLTSVASGVLLGFVANLEVEGIFTGRLAGVFLATFFTYGLWMMVQNRARSTGRLTAGSEEKTEEDGENSKLLSKEHSKKHNYMSFFPFFGNRKKQDLSKCKNTSIQKHEVIYQVVENHENKKQSEKVNEVDGPLEGIYGFEPFNKRWKCSIL